jgi:hypothetical protein
MLLELDVPDAYQSILNELQIKDRQAFKASVHISPRKLNFYFWRSACHDVN